MLTTSRTSNATANNGGRNHEDSELPIGTQSMQSNVMAIAKQVKPEENKSMQVGSSANHIEVLEPLSKNFNGEISRSVSLINSSTDVLHSQMNKLKTEVEAAPDGYDHQTAVVAAMTAKGIADLIKTKVQLLRVQRDLDNDERERDAEAKRNAKKGRSKRQ